MVRAILDSAVLREGGSTHAALLESCNHLRLVCLAVTRATHAVALNNCVCRSLLCRCHRILAYDTYLKTA